MAFESFNTSGLGVLVGRVLAIVAWKRGLLGAPSCEMRRRIGDDRDNDRLSMSLKVSRRILFCTDVCG